MNPSGRASSGDYDELQADGLNVTVAQVRLLRTAARKTVVRPGPRVLAVMDVLTQRGLVELRHWGRYVVTHAGHAAVHRPVRDQPVYLSDGGSLRYRTRPDGRQVVDDGIPDRERGYSTAREYETDTGSLEARGLTTEPGRRSKSFGGDPNEAIWQDPDELSWTWTHDAERRRRNAQPRRARAARLRRLGGST